MYEEYGVDVAFDIIERWIGGLGIIVGIVVFAFALWRGVWRGLQHPSGRTTVGADKLLRAPLLFILGGLWIGVCFILWRPIPLMLTIPARVIALILGALLYSLGLSIYLWGASTLREMYKVSSSFGVKLNVEHQLITHGPFALVRHPLYLGLQVAAVGGLMLYQTWTFVFVVVNFLGLIFRAKREEEALAMEFGEHWKVYARRVPAWIPRLHR